MLTMRAPCRGRQRAGTDDGDFRRRLHHIWSDHIREKDGEHVYADTTCTSNAYSLQRHGATAPPDNLLHIFVNGRD